MYNHRYGLVLGFHGCDKKVRDIVVNGGSLKPSLNDYDWLGNGIYFWENDPQRALMWAQELAQRNPDAVREPAVLGAVIDLGNCLDTTTQKAISAVKIGYELLKDQQEKHGLPMPENKNIRGNKDWLLRRLDCAVIEQLFAATKEDSSFESYDSVRGVFFEGGPVYENAGFREKTHTQLCIRNPNCIRAYFIPREPDPNFPKV